MTQTPWERLLAESLPTGTFGDVRPPAPAPSPVQKASRRTSVTTTADAAAHPARPRPDSFPEPRHPVAAWEAAEHVRILLRELDEHNAAHRFRHLYAVPDNPPEQAAS